MNTQQLTAMQMALDALEAEFYDDRKQVRIKQAITALREALAQQQVSNCQQLSTSTDKLQGKWVDLTDDEILECAPINGATVESVAIAVAAKLKEKNTPPVVPQIEPVVGAYEVVNESGTEWELVYPAAIHKYKMIPEHRITQTFYTTPPSVEAAIEATKQREAFDCCVYQQKDGAVITSYSNQEQFEQMLSQSPAIVKYVEAAVLAEREACAKVCEGIGWGNNPYVNPKAGTTCAAAIRSRGKNDCGGAQHHRYAGSFGG